MSQQNILNLLKRKKKWMTAKQIATILKINSGTAIVSLQKLYRQGDILRKNSKPNKGIFNMVGYNPYLWMIK